DAVRQTAVKTYFCPTRRQPGVLSISGDQPDTPWSGSLNHYSGSVGDYAVCLGSEVDLDYNGDGGNGAIIVAQQPSPYEVATAPMVLAAQKSQTRFDSIADGLSNTLFAGEKHVQIGRFGINDFNGLTDGDGSIYNGDHPWIASRAAGLNHPLAVSAR